MYPQNSLCLKEHHCSHYEFHLLISHLLFVCYFVFNGPEIMWHVDFAIMHTFFISFITLGLICSATGAVRYSFCVCIKLPTFVCLNCHYMLFIAGLALQFLASQRMPGHFLKLQQKVSLTTSIFVS